MEWGKKIVDERSGKILADIYTDDPFMPTILIVEDDPDMLSMVETVFVSSHFTTYAITKCSQVYDLLEAVHPDIILMDIQLGDTDGRILCYEVKTVDKYRGGPVILYSANVISEASLRHCLADGFIAKPFDINLLISQVRCCLTA